MNSKRWIMFVAGALLLCLAAGFAVRSSLEAEEKQPPAARENPFVGKIIVVYQKSDIVPGSYSAALEDPTFIDLKGHPFLTGKRADKRESPWNGLKTSIPLDNVASIYEFDDLESYREFEEKAEAEVEAAGFEVPMGVAIPRAAVPETDPDSE